VSEPILPLYDQSTDLRAWWDGDHIFDLDLNWIAFVYDGHAFTASVDSRWLGPARHGVMMDTSGRVILWTPDKAVQGEVSPYRPARAPRPPRPEKPPRPGVPPRPYKPPRPSDGWSQLSFEEWFGELGRGPAQPDEVAGVSPNEISFEDED
jgi:hypothetical protein